MINKFNARFIVLVVFAILASCSRKPENMVSFVKNFNETVQNQQNLIFTFNQDIIDAEKIGDWDSVEYIKFSPEVKGRFRWAATNELVFSPAKGFAPSTDYEAEFTKQLLKKTKNSKLYLGDEYEEFKFHTEYLAPQELSAFWAKGNSGSGVVIRLGISFNYKVDPKQLKDFVNVEVGGKPASFTLDNADISDEVFLTINGTPFGKEQSLIKVKFSKGIQIANGDYKTKEEFELNQVLSSRFDLQILNVESGFKNNKGYIRVFTSQEIEAENLENAYTVSPTVDSKAEVTENGLRITGDFVINQVYTLTLKKQYLKGTIGGELKEDSRHEVSFGELPPSISFRNKKAIYLSKSGSKNIGVDIVNIPEVRVKVYKIYENNILAYMRSNSYYDYYYDGYYDENGNAVYRLDNSGVYSSEVLDRTIKTKDFPKVNGVTAFNLDLPKIDDFKGIYLIQISSKTDYYLNATKMVSVSDIGLITKQAENDLFIYANSILTAEAMGNVDLHVISKNNQDILKVKTNSDGIAIVKDFKKKLKHFKTAMITAKKGSDFNYLLFSQTGVETSRFDVSGKRDHKTGLDVFIYGDRNIYRPGETVYFNSIVRDKDWKPVADIPLKVKIIMPNGKEYSSIRKNTSRQGSVDGKFVTSVSAVTGNYTIEVYNGNDVLLSSKRIGIEEFMPDRIKSTLTTDKKEYHLTDNITASIEAVNYFGPPAADKNYEIDFSLSRKNFSPKNFKDYNFHIDSRQSFSRIVRTGKTDDNGIAKEKIKLPTTYKDMGVLRAKLYATVFDESGRPVNRTRSVDVFTQKIMYGIHMDDNYVGVNQPMKTKLVAVNKAGKLVNGAKAEVQVIRYEWQNVLTRYGSGYRYKSKRIEKVMSKKTVTFRGGKGVINFIPPVSGSYEVRVKRIGANRHVSSWFYAYRWGSTLNTSFDVNTEGAVDIVFDKEKYEVGDKAKVLFKTPFIGKLLITLERNGILEHRIVNTDKKSAEITLTVKDEYLPNIYVSATLIKSLENSGIPLMVAHGYASLSVEKKATILPIDIKAVAKSRSSRKQKITIKTKPEKDVEVTIAVVDEGILALKNFKTPDPHGHFYAKRALEVSSYDLYPYLFPEMRSSSSGGDGYDLEKRVNPLSNNRVKLVAFWSGVLKTNSRGEATYEIDIPKFSGDLRIMAVAYKNKAFGSASTNMKVADPLVVTSGLPRFFSPGDIIEMPVNISNTTKKTANSSVSVKVSGPVEAINTGNESITIKANKENRVIFKLKAKAQIGEAKIKVSVRGLGETFVDETDITVRPSTSLLKTSVSGQMKAGATKVLEMNADYIPSSIESKLVISKNPMTEFIDRFDRLIGYPHGCVEQTVSKAFPQIYFADFVKNAGSNTKIKLRKGDNEMNPAFNVREAIRKLQGMQLYNGSMTYWAGGYYETWWGSTYAAHFLLEAKKAGYDVDNNVLDKLISYLNYKANTKKIYSYRYYTGNDYVLKKYVAREVIYSLYVLSRAGQPNRSVMNYYKGNKDLLTNDCKYLLAGAFSIMGDRSSFKEIIPKTYYEYDLYRSTGGSFYSPMRNLAISLHALVESNIEHPQIPVLARNLSTQLKNSRYTNTQELAFTFLALGKLAQNANKANVSATIKVNGKVIGNFANKDVTISSSKLKGKNVTISSSGKGAIYYYYETEGLSSTGKYIEEDNYLRVRKDFFNRYGQKINGNTFKQNDLIVVRISIAALQNMDIDNVVVTDMLPAGFEIENPRITEGRDFKWTGNRAYPQHFDVRDDRINFFLNPRNREKYLYYTVRAVTKGTYRMGPVSADAMYNGEYHSYHGAGEIIIK
jgi:hypothetical protein